jgi:hypothetical protein
MMRLTIKACVVTFLVKGHGKDRYFTLCIQSAVEHINNRNVRKEKDTMIKVHVPESEFINYRTNFLKPLVKI